MQPKKVGRPKKWTDGRMVGLANLLDELRKEHVLRSYDAAVEKLIELIAAKVGKSPRSTFTAPLATVRGVLRKCCSRGRQLRSKPPSNSAELFRYF